MKGNQGFTIAELLVVMAVIALVGAFSLPYLTKTRSQAEMHSEVRSALQSARNRAIAERRQIDFVIDTNTRSLAIDGKPLDIKWDGGITWGIRSARRNTKSGVALFRFFPNGTSSGGEITLRSSNQTRIIALNWVTGGIKVAELPQ
jgi:general secretion pathway protein H